MSKQKKRKTLPETKLGKVTQSAVSLYRQRFLRLQRDWLPTLRQRCAGDKTVCDLLDESETFMEKEAGGNYGPFRQDNPLIENGWLNYLYWHRVVDSMDNSAKKLREIGRIQRDPACTVALELLGRSMFEDCLNAFLLCALRDADLLGFLLGLEKDRQRDIFKFNSMLTSIDSDMAEANVKSHGMWRSFITNFGERFPKQRFQSTASFDSQVETKTSKVREILLQRDGDPNGEAFDFFEPTWKHYCFHVHGGIDYAKLQLDGNTIAVSSKTVTPNRPLRELTDEVKSPLVSPYLFILTLVEYDRWLGAPYRTQCADLFGRFQYSFLTNMTS